MIRTRDLLVGATFVVFGTTLFATACADAESGEAPAAQNGVQAPMFEVDPFWPKPLPDHGLLGAPSAWPSTHATTSTSSTETPQISSPREPRSASPRSHR